ncbi:MAG: hypothetical protein WCF03_13920 [Nitrososphaeraceae archaeon]
MEYRRYSILSSKSSSNSNNKESINDNNNNSSIDLALTQSAVVSLIDAYTEFLKNAPKIIEYWYNIFSEPWNRTTTTTIENQKSDKVKVE